MTTARGKLATHASMQGWRGGVLGHKVCMVEVVAEVTHPGVVVVGLVVVGDEGGGNQKLSGGNSSR
jgi:hypothetical protein